MSHPRFTVPYQEESIEWIDPAVEPEPTVSVDVPHSNPIPSNRVLVPSYVIHPERVAKCYPRLAPVPRSESSVYDIITHEPAVFRTLLPGQKFTIQPHLLHAITRTLDIPEPIPKEVWEGRYDNAEMWGRVFGQYEPVKTEGDYARMVGCEDAFGPEFNSFEQVELFCRSMEQIDTKDSQVKSFYVKMQFISMVCLQIYTMERNRWMKVKIDDFFDESYPPWIFLFFPNYDVKNTPGTVPEDCSVAEAARRFDYTTLVYFVACRKMPDRRLMIEKWIKSKIFNNVNMFLITTRFSLVNIKDYDKHINQSILRLTRDRSSESFMVNVKSKHFAEPQWLLMNVYKITSHKQHLLDNTNGVPDVRQVNDEKATLFPVRIPLLFAHFFLNPEQPMTDFSGRTRYAEDVDRYDQMRFADVAADCRLNDWRKSQIFKCLDDGLIGDVNKLLNGVFASWIQSQKEKEGPKRKRARVVSKPAVAVAIAVDATPGTELKIDVGNASVKEHIRPSFHPSPNECGVNQLRARYSYILHDKLMFTNVVPFLPWSAHEELDFDGSPLLIRNEVWSWLYDRSADSDQLAFRIQNAITDRPTEGWTPVCSGAFYFDSKRLGIQKDSFEYFLIDYLASVRSQQMPRTKVMWDLVYRALLLLLESECEAVRFLCDSGFKGDRFAALTELRRLHSLRDSRLLGVWRSRVGRISGFQKVLEQSIQEWDRHNCNVVRSEMWMKMLDSRILHNYTMSLYSFEVVKVVKKVKTRKGDDTETAFLTSQFKDALAVLLKSTFEALSKCQEQVIRLEIPESMAGCRILVRDKENKSDITCELAEIPDLLVRPIKEIVTGMCFLFAYLFPHPLVQPASFDSSQEELMRSIESSPEAMNVLYQLTRKSQSKEIIQEAKTLLGRMREAEKDGCEWRLPIYTEYIYNMIYHILAKYDLSSNPVLHDYKETLNSLLKRKLLLDQGLKGALVTSFRHLTHVVAMRKMDAIDAALSNQVSQLLYPHCLPHEVPMRILDLFEMLVKYDPSYLETIGRYRAKCLERPNALIVAGQASDSVAWIRSSIAKAIQTNYRPQIVSEMIEGLILEPEVKTRMKCITE